MKYLIMLSILLTSIAIAEPMKQSHYKQHGDTKIFYSAFESSFIAPEVAVAYNFVRGKDKGLVNIAVCLLYTSPSPRDGLLSRMPSSA